MANEARLLIRADDKASKVLRDVSGEAEKAARPLNEIGKIAAGFVVGQGLLKLPGLFSSTVGAASDLAEAGSKVTVVFGPDAVEVTQFAKLADNIGLSDAAALSATGTFGNLFVSMGMPTKEAATMSTEIVKLAADLASFNNIEIADALQKLQAGLVGETEPLRALGVNLSADAVAAKALEMGLAATKAELTAADKATASYNLILEQTKTAQGDFARTSDGLANKQRMLKADFADLQAEIGQKFVPAMAAGVDITGKMVAAADDIPLGTVAIAGMGVAALAAAPHVMKLGGGIADLVTDIRKGDRPLNTFGTRLGALTVGLVAADLASQAFTGRSQTTHASATDETGIDFGAQTTAGAVGFLQHFSGGSGTIKYDLEDSSDSTTGADGSWANLGAFSDVATPYAAIAQRIAISGTVERWTRAATNGTFTDAVFAMAIRRLRATDYDAAA